MKHKKKGHRSVIPIALLLCLGVPKISTPGVIFLLKIYSQRTNNPPGLLCPNCARQGQKLTYNSKRNQKLALEKLASQGFEKIKNQNFKNRDSKSSGLHALASSSLASGTSNIKAFSVSVESLFFVNFSHCARNCTHLIFQIFFMLPEIPHFIVDFYFKSCILPFMFLSFRH